MEQKRPTNYLLSTVLIHFLSPHKTTKALRFGVLLLFLGLSKYVRATLKGFLLTLQGLGENNNLLCPPTFAAKAGKHYLRNMGTLKPSEKQKAARKRQLLIKKIGKRTPAQLKKQEGIIGIWADRTDIDSMTLREEAWGRR